MEALRGEDRAVSESLPQTKPTPQADRLRALEHNWDSYEGIPITAEALRAAEGVERSFTLVPHSDGGFQIEIHAAGIDVEIEINPNGTFESSWVGKSS